MNITITSAIKKTSNSVWWRELEPSGKKANENLAMQVTNRHTNRGGIAIREEVVHSLPNESQYKVKKKKKQEKELDDVILRVIFHTGVQK